MSAKQLLSIFLLLVTALLTGQVSADDHNTLNERTFTHFATLLDTYLEEKTLENDGLVSAFDYQSALDDSDTNNLLAKQDALLTEFDIDQLDTREQAIAFWNNAYNYFMIQKILTDLNRGKLVDSVWDYGGRYNPLRASVFERDLFDIGGKKTSLNTMEKGKLLGDEFKQKGWKEARVHFTVNCASVGCPPLRSQIYTADNIDELMTENTRRAFNTPRHLHQDGDTLYLSELFKWYEGDYVDEEGSVRAFIKAYADERIIEKVDATNRVRFIDYDWDLNRPEHFPEFDGS